MQQRGGDDDFAAHPFGIRAEQFVRQRFKAQVEKSKKLLDANPRRVLRNAIQRGDHFEIFQPAERFEHRAGFRHETDVAFDLDRLCAQIETANRRRAFGGLDHAGQHFQRRGFARAIRAEKANNLSGGNFERKRVDGDLRAETFGQLLQ